MWRVNTFVFTIILLSTSIVNAEDILIYGIDIIEFGVYTSKISQTVSESDTTMGKRHIVKEILLVKQTDEIQAEIGVQFGFRYIVRGVPEGAKAQISMVTILPPEGLRNTKTGDVKYRNQHTVYNTLGKKSFRAYLIEEEWEIVSGKWTFQLFHENRKLAEKTFTVFKP